MDKLAKWHAHIVDLRSLFASWEHRHADDARWTRRFREIHSICMFALCMENGTDHRYLVGFPALGPPNESVSTNRLFDDGFGEIEDCDVLLVDDPKTYGPSTVLHHRCQLTSFVNQPSTDEVQWVRFLDKKLSVPRDNDLRLVIHVEQEGRVNFAFVSAYLSHRTPRCPYSQVFMYGQNGFEPRKWFCVLVYPQMAVMPELDEETARRLIVDREQYCRPVT